MGMNGAMLEVNDIDAALVAAAVIDRARPSHCDDERAAVIADCRRARVRTPAAHGFVMRRMAHCESDEQYL
jgi:hypothetical protein